MNKFLTNTIYQGVVNIINRVFNSLVERKSLKSIKIVYITEIIFI
jgi:hypothetical protein